ncbi:hypothetical protein P152DRAFT_149532 [Eremomyces bilateralis CBS 781.70]|uniref:Uncharacterized protein n=1 Tax=Eremomyces bilateralis CBS 781.70 TaxID=1392243 RepID=A0A6G1FVX6_9PEZI|nr:uncharacterized protein P152DRAFT_149532 [Eremomyces bilateralis CBS 781.70]KAF1809779.1 hypothetical protein P152DRAFT_149532 [Eremomyces bilateralis CBS 781.70]
MSIQSPLPHIIANPDGCIRFEKAPTTNDEHSKLNGKERIAIGNICDQHDKEGDMVSRTPGTKDVSTPLEKSGDAAQLGAPSLVPSNQPQTAAPTLSKEPYMSLSTESTASSSSIEAAEISAGSNPTASSPIVNEATGGGRLDIADSFQGKLQGSSIPKSSIAEPEPLTWKRKVAQMNDFGLAEYTPTLSVDGRAKKTMRGCKLSRENKSPHIEPKATEPKVTDRAATVEEPRRKKIKTNPIAKFAKVVMPAAFLGAVVGGAATFIGLASMAE